MKADRRIEGQGCPESTWLAWIDSVGVPLLRLDEWLPATSRLVVVAPHPDDEVLACGALLSMHAERGGAGSIVAVTDGEASHPGSSEWTPDRLASTRRAESAEGLLRLEFHDVEVLRLSVPDGRVREHTDELERVLKHLLRPTDVVVSTWRLDGHPDHDASGLAAAQACAAVRCRHLEAPVWMWHWSEPDDPRVPWHRLRSLSVDAQAWQRKQAAVAAHRSQRSPREGGQGPVLGAEILARAARRFEYFFV